MIKLPFKQHIADLASILKQHGVKHVVLCPGSRNAPLMQVFERDASLKCFSIVDERSAAYVALGMAKESGKPVVIATTSGTAALNLAPAVAEAYYQKIPLIVLTADRPPEWPPQFGNQRIRQEDIFSQNSKGAYSLPLEINSPEELKEINQQVDKLIGNSYNNVKGPVHLNIPLLEPLYEEIPKSSTYLIQRESEQNTVSIPAISDEKKELIRSILLQQRKVMIIAGMQQYSEEESTIAEALSDCFQVVTVAENIANFTSPVFISRPEIVLAKGTDEEDSSLVPDLVILFGDQVVSKKLRLLVQSIKREKIVVLDHFPLDLFAELIPANREEKKQENTFLQMWKAIENKSAKTVENYLQNSSFSNLTASNHILRSIPENAIIHLGNSGTIRYSQLFASRPDLHYYSNRGTSGIDGSLSTAVGSALVSDKLHVILMGDLSFVYDSNALWNRNFPKNLKIIVLNDHGGGIFRLLDGPDRMPFFEEYSVTSHPVSLEQLTKAFGFEYRKAENYNDLSTGLKWIFNNENTPSILEVETGKSQNSRIFKGLYKTIQDQ